MLCLGMYGGKGGRRMGGGEKRGVGKGEGVGGKGVGWGKGGWEKGVGWGKGGVKATGEGWVGVGGGGGVHRAWK